MTKDFEFVEDLLPDGAIPLASLRLVYYLGEDAKRKYRFLWEGEGSATDIIGILEVIKSELVTQSYFYGGNHNE